MRQKGTATRYPGVQSLSNGMYRLRAKVINPKTGQPKEIDQLKLAASALAASKIRAELIAEAMTEHAQQERQRLATFSLSWLKEKRSELKASTFERYTRTLAHHIVPQLGDHFVDAITHQDIIRWRDAQKAKPGTINSRLRVLKTVLADAVHHLGLARDPSERVAAIRDIKVDEEPNSLTPEQLRAVLEAMRTTRPRWYALVAVLAFTGMRKSEATALYWSDVDMDQGSIHIRRSSSGGGGKVDTTKTNTKRVASLDPALGAILRDHRRRLDELGLATEGDAWVFASEKAGHRGKPVHKNSIREPLLDALKAAKLEERLTVHGLRRTMNNLLRQVAGGEVARSIIGHVTEQMTEHYSTVRLDEKAKATSQVLRLVRGRVGSGDSGGDALPEKKTAG